MERAASADPTVQGYREAQASSSSSTSMSTPAIATATATTTTTTTTTAADTTTHTDTDTASASASATDTDIATATDTAGAGAEAQRGLGTFPPELRRLVAKFLEPLPDFLMLSWTCHLWFRTWLAAEFPTVRVAGSETVTNYRLRKRRSARPNAKNSGKLLPPVQQLVVAIRSRPHILELDLSECATLDMRPVLALSFPQLKVIQLGNVKRCGVVLPDFLQRHSFVLREFWVANARGMTLCQMIFKTLTTLETLSIMNAETVQGLMLRRIVDVAPRLRDIRIVNAPYVSIQGHVRTIFSPTKQIEVLILNGLNSYRCEDSLDTLLAPHAATLRWLDLGHRPNAVFSESSSVVWRHELAFPKLKVLNLHGSPVSDSSVINISENCENLEVLNLSKCRNLTNVAFERAAVQLTCLNVFDISGTKFSEPSDHLSPVLELLQESQTGRHVRLNLDNCRGVSRLSRQRARRSWEREHDAAGPHARALHATGDAPTLARAGGVRAESDGSGGATATRRSSRGRQDHVSSDDEDDEWRNEDDDVQFDDDTLVLSLASLQRGIGAPRKKSRR